MCASWSFRHSLTAPERPSIRGIEASSSKTWAADPILQQKGKLRFTFLFSPGLHFLQQLMMLLFSWLLVWGDGVTTYVTFIMNHQSCQDQRPMISFKKTWNIEKKYVESFNFSIYPNLWLLPIWSIQYISFYCNQHCAVEEHLSLCGIKLWKYRIVNFFKSWSCHFCITRISLHPDRVEMHSSHQFGNICFLYF